MKQFFVKFFPFIATSAALVALFGLIVVVYMNTVRVSYTVIDANGATGVEIWEKSGQVVSYFDQKRNFIGRSEFGTQDGMYFENQVLVGVRENDFIRSEFILEKSPEVMSEKEEVIGRAMITATNVLDATVLELSMEKVVRSIDGRIVHTTIFGQSDGPVNVITRLYDNEKSTYYMPDEILDQVIEGDTVTSSVHHIAKDRAFVPLTYRHSKNWM